MDVRSVDVLVDDLTRVDIDEDLLSTAELGRALGFGSPAMLKQYLAAHTWLRRRLSDYLGAAPDEIRFAEGGYGKPVIVSPQTDLSFNLSYSNGMALLALGYDMAVGVDMEPLDRARINRGMLHRVLSPGEIDLVLSSDDEVRTFLELWVRKEALAKAAGLGVDEEITAIDLRGVSPVLMDGFEVADLNIGDRFVAAAAVPPGCRIQMSTLIEAAV